MSARASSRKPSTTLTVFIQPPLFGIDLSIVGNMAKSEKGRARAMANPAMPTAGEMKLLVAAASTSSVPMIGPVQLNETRQSVKAMKKIEM